jgi:hypothetical protein
MSATHAGTTPDPYLVHLMPTRERQRASSTVNRPSASITPVTVVIVDLPDEPGLRVDAFVPRVVTEMGEHMFFDLAS